MVTSADTAMTIGRGIRCVAAGHADKLALSDSLGQSRTYTQLTARMDAVGRLATAHALGKGDVVALIAPNCIEYAELVCGFSERGIVVATLNPMLAAEELARIFDDCNPRLIIAAASVDVPAHDRPLIELGEQLEYALAQASASTQLPQIDERETFAISYTSGTTGLPKGVMLSHRSRCLMFYAMATEYDCFGRDDHFLGLAPMCHGAGLAFALAPLFNGGRCTLQYAQQPEDLLAAIDQHQPNGIFVVPTHLHRIFSAPAALRAAYRGRHRLRTIISNAAALSPTLKRAAVDYFGDGLLHETYGSTEGGIVTNIRPQEILAKPRSVGPAFSNMEIELRRDDGTIASPGEPGELYSRSPFSFSGYLNRPEETEQALADGWVTVGDIATCDEAGYITITDRKKDMVVSGGMNVYPREVETIIEASPGVVECAVVGVPDAEWGERLHVFAVTGTDTDIDANEILAACRGALAAYKVPKGVTFIDQLPRNPAGKLIKRELR
ncbi:MAG: class I adenylate-forming enzyme family protein, partial [Pseudomonadota bacterium]